MTDLLQDARFAIRQMLKNKTFSAIAVTALASAIAVRRAVRLEPSAALRYE